MHYGFIQLVDVKDVDALIADHLNKGMAEVGFHYMIEKNGTTKTGRSISFIGNNMIGHNADSIGIACIGTQLIKIQEAAIDNLLEELSIKGVSTDNVFIVENGELKKYR